MTCASLPSIYYTEHKICWKRDVFWLFCLLKMESSPILFQWGNPSLINQILAFICLASGLAISIFVLFDYAKLQEYKNSYEFSHKYSWRCVTQPRSANSPIPALKHMKNGLIWTKPYLLHLWPALTPQAHLQKDPIIPHSTRDTQRDGSFSYRKPLLQLCRHLLTHWTCAVLSHPAVTCICRRSKIPVDFFLARDFNKAAEGEGGRTKYEELFCIFH